MEQDERVLTWVNKCRHQLGLQPLNRLTHDLPHHLPGATFHDDGLVAAGSSLRIPPRAVIEYMNRCHTSAKALAAPGPTSTGATEAPTAPAAG